MKLSEEYGITQEGFVLKRMDTILEEIHADLSEGFGFDTRLNPQSFLNVLITTFGSQIADMWEVAQNSYYAKYPATAEGINLDNAVQYSGIRRQKSKKTYYPIHCTGLDGTLVRKGVMIASTTVPPTKLLSAMEFTISRESFNVVSIRVVALVEGNYSVSVNGLEYTYVFDGNGTKKQILEGLKKEIDGTGYTVEVDTENFILKIADKMIGRSNVLLLSENLTTVEVTTIASFETEGYGKFVLQNETITDIITNVGGLYSVTNLLPATYGRLQETDIELRHSYLAKSAIRSNRMIDSIVSQLLNNVDGVESATGYENSTNIADSEGRPPHSIEIVVEGGDDTEIAQVILEKKAAGIQTFGNTEIQIATTYGDLIPVRFNRPQYIYAWLKVTLYGDKKYLPENYKNLTETAILKYTNNMIAGDSFIIQLLHKELYDVIPGLTYIKIEVVKTKDRFYVPKAEEYIIANILSTSREKILVSPERIEVVLDEEN